MKTRQRSGTPGDNDERRDEYGINNNCHILSTNMYTLGLASETVQLQA